MALISDEYRKLQANLHKHSNFGTTGAMYADYINELIAQYGFKSVLDYGAGKCNLGEKLNNITYIAYEPSNPKYSDTPSPCEFVISIDVLEHIEPECLADVLNDLKRVTINYGFFTIHTKPAKKFLADGRNAHLIQEKMSWWYEKLNPMFEILNSKELPNRCEFFVRALNGIR